jgi:hypothetical protein
MALSGLLFKQGKDIKDTHRLAVTAQHTVGDERRKKDQIKEGDSMGSAHGYRGIVIEECSETTFRTTDGTATIMEFLLSPRNVSCS